MENAFTVTISAEKKKTRQDNLGFLYFYDKTILKM